jgi:hypothetical protein
MDLNRQYRNRNLEARRKELLRKEWAVKSLRDYKRRVGNRRAQIMAAFSGEDGGPLAGRIIQLLKNVKRKVRDAQRCQRLLLVAQRESELLEQEDEWYLKGVIRLGCHWMSWQRQPEDWKPRSHNVQRQFGSLARHLLANYPVPAFMDRAWLDSPHCEHESWFIHIGQGRNIRKADRLPIALTKMMAHQFLLAPEQSSVEEALRWGQLRGMGLSVRLTEAVLGRLGTFDNPQREAFWATFFNFLVHNPMIDPHQIGPIIDYLHNQKFVDAQPVRVGGTFVHQGPPQPGLSMKGRDPDALVRQVEAWHRQLRKVRAGENLVWAPCGVRAFDRIEGEAGSQRRFVVKELLSSQELRAEGSAMRHCVATYAHSCVDGRSAVFSLQLDQGNGLERLMTIELNPRLRQIVQARGKYNAPASSVAQRILQAWATFAGLSFSRYALTRFM